jgi:quercetin dioxygenase-like cupin family protein
VKLNQLDSAQARPTSEPHNFEGSVRMLPLVPAADSEEVTLLAVFFEDGARTRPHVHATDQVLLVVDGTCVVANREQRRELPTGGVALVKAGEWHWHGAAPGGSACHVSIRKAGATDWDVPRHDW